MIDTNLNHLYRNRNYTALRATMPIANPSQWLLHIE